jgi:hypothetical protein
VGWSEGMAGRTDGAGSASPRRSPEPRSLYAPAPTHPTARPPHLHRHLVLVQRQELADGVGVELGQHHTQRGAVAGEHPVVGGQGEPRVRETARAPCRTRRARPTPSARHSCSCNHGTMSPAPGPLHPPPSPPTCGGPGSRARSGSAARGWSCRTPARRPARRSCTSARRGWTRSRSDGGGLGRVQGGGGSGGGHGPAGGVPGPSCSCCCSHAAAASAWALA